MKKFYSFLIAAIFMLAIPMGMMGQASTTKTAFYGFETGDTGWTATSFVTNNTAVEPHGGSIYGATNGGSSADVKYNTIVESPQSLTCYYTKTTTNTNAGSKFHIQVSTNNSTWTTVASSLGMNDVTKGTWYELTADLSSYSNVYIRVHYDGTSAVRALDDITLVYLDSGVAPAVNYDVDFESASDEYISWTFNNMTSKQTGSITAHGGTYYGTTGGKGTASITTTSTVANPGTLTCYVSKQTTNNTSSTWYIQVSENGSTWTDVKTQSATSMSSGSWTEFSANLSSFSNVYVRVYYSGSTAVRNIDDLTLTTVEPSPAVATTTTINEPQNFNTDIYQGTNPGTLTATVKDNENNVISGATVTWESSNTGVATIDDNGAVTLVAVGTTTITASYAGVEDQYRPSEGTYELTVVNEDPNAPGTQNNPYTVAQARAAIDASTGTQGVYATGIVCRASNSLYQNKYLSYYISADGSTESDQLEAYNGLGINGANFTDVNDVQVGDIVVIYGNLTKHNSTYEFAANNQLVSLVRPAQYTLTNAMTNVSEYFVFVGDEEIEFDANNQVQITAGKTVYVSLTMDDCYTLTSLTVNGSTTDVTEIQPGIYYSFVMPEGDATIGVLASQATQYTLTVVGGENVSFDMLKGSESTPVTFTNGTASICEQMHVTIDDLTVPTGYVLDAITLSYGNTSEEVNPAVGFTMPSSNATLTFTTHEAETFTYTKVNSVMPGKHYIIVTSSADSNGKYHAMGGKNSDGSFMNPVEVSVDNNTVTVADNEGVAEILIGGTTGKYTLHTSEGYLVGGNKSLNNNGTESSTWSISFNASNQAEIIWAINTTNYSLQYNSASPRFACYSSSQTKVCLYEKNEPATETFTRDIAQYTSGKNDGWYLIASPVAVDIENNPMVEGTYDLYRFNPTATQKEWENYKNTEHSDFTTLEVGRGYLYANGNNGGIQLSFSGVPSNNGTVTATYDGWNLIGNPFGTAATVNKDYYRMNDTHTGIMSEVGTGSVAPLEGIFVNATANENITFTPVEAKSRDNSTVVMNLSQNRGGIIDRAIVRFGNSNRLPKYQLFENSTMIYIAQDGEDYAIVSAEAQGEMPVNFKANQSGEYTISINTENVEMNYLHLIDNLTGNDVDLLATPSYTFNAMADDYASRFRLVFSANNAESNSNNFAFISDGQIVLTEQGDALVYDVMGRMISRHNNVSHITTEGLAAGVYVIRLTNGSETMTQKIVVK